MLSIPTGQALQRLSENELLAGARSTERERGAFVEELFRRNYGKVVAWCLRFGGGRAEAQDLAQAVFVRAYRHLDSFRGDSSFATWLYAITRSECMNSLVLKKRRSTWTSDEDVPEVRDEDGPSPDAGLEQQGSARVVKELLDMALDDVEKKVFVLHYGDGVPLDVITRLLGLSNRVGAKSYILRARRKLARALRVWKAREGELDA
jgi:RNA polymerase sigma-70 factor, ECF subfamily